MSETPRRQRSNDGYVLPDAVDNLGAKESAQLSDQNYQQSEQELLDKRNALAIAVEKEQARLDGNEELAEEQLRMKQYREVKSDAMRILSVVTGELVAGIGLGAYCGWQADKYFETRPLFFILLSILGFAAAMWSLLKYMNRTFPTNSSSLASEHKSEPPLDKES